MFAWGEGDSGGHVLRETTSRGLGGLVCPSRTSQRGGNGDCVKEGGREGGERERARALGVQLCHTQTERFRFVALRWHSGGIEVRLVLPAWAC